MIVADTAVASGPYDSSDWEEIGDLIDVGSLWIPAPHGLSLQFSVEQSSQRVMAVLYASNDSMLQLQAYAAPKSKGIWDSVRRDMRQSIAQQGGKSEEIEGSYGIELRAMVPAPQPQQYLPQRLIGVDGPRWMLKATISGLAAIDASVAAPFEEIVRQVVVDRGQEPHPPRELLSLHLPQKIAAIAALSGDSSFSSAGVA